MANFPTHIVVGTLVAGSLATLTLAADVIAPDNLVAITLAGSLGSVLPDIDLKDSRPSRALFSGLAVFFAFVLLFQFAPRLSIAEMWLLWLGTLLFVRYVLHTAFHRLANHRGVWHSLVAGLACAFFTMIIFYYVFGRHEGVAWLAGGFLFIGYVTHLALDEIYSVDVLGNRIKRSFGTALKLFDRRNLAGSALMAAVAGGLLLFTPPIATFYDGITSRSMWDSLHARLLPQEMWFGGVVKQSRLAGEPEPDTSSATGSIPPTSDPAAEASTAAQSDATSDAADDMQPTPAAP